MANDARRHNNRNSALLRIGFGNRVGIPLGDRWVEHLARSAFDEPSQVLIINPAVSFKIDAVDGRKFHNPDQQGGAARINLNTFEQSTVQNPLIGVVQLPTRDGFAACDSCVSCNRRRIDALIALNLDGVEAERLGVCIAG